MSDDLDFELFDDTELPPDHRSGFVTLVGKPNVGKSTLLNAWLGVKIVAVSAKPQTTRNRLLGILTRPDAQVVFVDTPGIHLPRTRLGEYMVAMARRAVPDADVILFMVDASEPPTRADQEVARLLEGVQDVPIVLVLNKIDLLSPEEAEAHRAAYEALGTFTASVPISALSGHNRDELLEETIALLPPGPRYYPEDQITDREERAQLTVDDLKKGAKFEDQAKDYSQDSKTREKGGDLGTFTLEDLTARYGAKFAEDVFALEQGKTSSELRSEKGFHVVKVTKETPAVEKPLESVQRDIARELVIAEQAEAKAKAEAERLLAGIKAGKTLEELTKVEPAPASPDAKPVQFNPL